MSPRDGENYLLPVSATSPVAEASKPVGTVILLGQKPNLAEHLRQALAASNILTQQYFTEHTFLADTIPAGPTCLVIAQDDSGLEALSIYEQLRAKGWRLPTIVLISNPEIRMVVQLMRAGAEDVLLNSCETEALLQSINSALNQSRKGLQRRLRGDDMQRRLEQLTPREVEVVKLVLAGMLNKEIAEKLHLALVTVKVHRGSAMRKLGARSAAELARLTLATDGLHPVDFTDQWVALPQALSSLPAD
ncbi:MAG: LuxR C-terminal-related transcriptional regulator [Verrucomicrobiota bacterium]